MWRRVGLVLLAVAAVSGEQYTPTYAGSEIVRLTPVHATQHPHVGHRCSADPTDDPLVRLCEVVPLSGFVYTAPPDAVAHFQRTGVCVNGIVYSCNGTRVQAQDCTDAGYSETWTTHPNSVCMPTRLSAARVLSIVLFSQSATLLAYLHYRRR